MSVSVEKSDMIDHSISNKLIQNTKNCLTVESQTFQSFVLSATAAWNWPVTVLSMLLSSADIFLKSIRSQIIFSELAHILYCLLVTLWQVRGWTQEYLIDFHKYVCDNVIFGLFFTFSQLNKVEKAVLMVVFCELKWKYFIWINIKMAWLGCSQFYWKCKSFLTKWQISARTFLNICHSRLSEYVKK